MKKLLLLATVSCAAAVAMTAPVQAATMYVGSWTVDQGPYWPDVPTAYSGQEAAALLFGGSASDYAISTIDDQIANIDHLAWVSTWGGTCGGAFPCGDKVAENFKISASGNYADVGDTSAYVYDWAVGGQYRNYAFRIDGAVPEPASWAMMIGGFAIAGAAMRRRSAKIAFA